MTRILIVSVPGLNGSSERWKKLEDAFNQRNVFPGAEVNWLHYGATSLVCRRGLAEISSDLDASINQEWEKKQGFDRVIMAGASAGALIARKAWLNAADKDQGADYTASPWGGRVERFVLFAGLSRGVNVDQSWWLRMYLREIERLPGRFSFEDCFRGSAFITDLRISWIRFITRLGDQAPMMLQLIGSRDDIVTKEDSIDLDVFPNTPPVTIPDASHHNSHWIERVKDPEGRLSLIIRQFQREPQRPSITEAEAYKERRVLLAVHGIRASRTDDWVKLTEEIVGRRWPDVVVRTPTYGYLSALRFAVPHIRRRYARYFRDFYTEVIAEHRNAKVSVICHSNGTYALGRSLSEFKAIWLDRIALAASVLPPDYDWAALRKAGRISEVRSDSACRDYPVAVLCRALRSLGMRDVGPGGFDGFTGAAVKEIRYHDGGHGSMLGQANLESMLAFLLDHDTPPASVPLHGNPVITRRYSRAAAIFAPLLVIAILSAVVYGTMNFGLLFAAIALALLALCFIVLDIF